MFHPTAVECTFSSSAHGLFSKTDHVIGHQRSLSKFKKIEIALKTFVDHNGMKLEICNRRKDEKFTNMWKLNNILPITNISKNK